jgi:hypothetical protein
LHNAGLKINATKSIFCMQEKEYLGYILTRDGTKLQPKKVQAILALNPPNNIKELWRFLGMVQYFRDMWQKRSDMLAPLTDLVGECRETKTTKKNKTKKKPWQWESIHQQAFDNVKATITKEMVLAYPGFTKPFEIYTDASTMQLGSVITQGNRPIAFFSRKLSIMQTKYSVTEIELLAIVEISKEFQGMLWGQTIKDYTDHNNITQDTLGLTSDRVYRWQLLLEEFAPEIVYIKGIHNTVADAVSWLDYNPKVNPTSKFNYSTYGIQEKGDTTVKWKAFSKLWHCYNENNPGNETQECNLNKVFANRSEEEEIFPLTTPAIAEAQKANSELKHCFRHNAVIDNGLEVRLVDGTFLVCKDGKMIIPKSL